MQKWLADLLRMAADDDCELLVTELRVGFIFEYADGAPRRIALRTTSSKATPLTLVPLPAMAAAWHCAPQLSGAQQVFAQRFDHSAA